jgi:AraC-like DNA-binding protein
MDFNFDTRHSDSPYVEAIYRTQSASIEEFISTAAYQWEMVITHQHDKATLSIRGPETKARPAPVPQDAEFLGIIFKMGTFMPHLPASDLVDTELHLPESTSNKFWFYSSAWQFPDFDNADTFIDRLIHEEILVHEPVVQAVLKGEEPNLSLRSVQRRFVQATGLTCKTIEQIQRAQQALALLQGGTPILDTVYELGYTDQSHLTHSLKRFIGQTPAEIARLALPE